MPFEHELRPDDFGTKILGEGSILTLANLKQKFVSARQSYKNQGFFKATDGDSEKPYIEAIKLLDALIQYHNASQALTFEQRKLLYTRKFISAFDEVIGQAKKPTEQQHIAWVLSDYFNDEITKGKNDRSSYKLYLAAELTGQVVSEYKEQNVALPDYFKQQDDEVGQEVGASAFTRYSVAVVLCKSVAHSAKSYSNEVRQAYLNQHATKLTADAMKGVLKTLTLDNLLAAFTEGEKKYGQQTHLALDPGFHYNFRSSVQHWTRFLKVVVACNNGDDQDLLDQYSLNGTVSNDGNRELRPSEKCIHILGFYFHASTKGGIDARSLKLHVIAELLGCDLSGLEPKESGQIYNNFISALEPLAGGMSKSVNAAEESVLDKLGNHFGNRADILAQAKQPLWHSRPNMMR